ncbi:MAG: ABC-F family ATP-binding cassette domain-containing protein [Longicatena sp.]
MLISVEHLVKHQNIKSIVQDGSLTIEDHDKIALIGVNGTGKTTLLRILAGEEPYEEGTILKKNGLRIAYLPQNPMFQEKESILHQVVSMDKEIKEFEAKAILDKLGLRDVNQNIALLSGGQRKRVALARALLQPCDLLILDEPTNHLDNTMIEWLEKYLIKFNRAILMVTHDRYFLERICDKMIEIDHGNLFSYEANYSLYLEMSQQRNENAIASEKKRQNLLRKELAWMRAGVQARGTKSKERIDRFHKLNEAASVQSNGQLALDTITSRLGKKTIEIENLSKSYDGRNLFHDFSYQVTKNDRIGILGMNGCGKSTLLHILAKEIAPDSGHVIHGETVQIAYFKQGYEDMDMSMKVIDYIKATSNEIQTLDGTFSASQMLERFLFEANQHYALIGRLSGGERRRLYLLKVLMSAPNILFLDEPTNDLDIQTLQILEDYLDNFNGAVLVVSHDRYFLDRICDKLFAFQENGEIRQFIGGYSAYIQLDTTNKNIEKETKKKYEKVNLTLRLSSKEKKELDNMEVSLAQKQEEIHQADLALEKYANDFVKLSEIGDTRNILENELEEMMERWMYLSDKQQAIEEAKK